MLKNPTTAAPLGLYPSSVGSSFLPPEGCQEICRTNWEKSRSDFHFFYWYELLMMSFYINPLLFRLLGWFYHPRIEINNCKNHRPWAHLVTEICKASSPFTSPPKTCKPSLYKTRWQLYKQWSGSQLIWLCCRTCNYWKPGGIFLNLSPL